MACSCTPETCVCKTRIPLQLVEVIKHNETTYSYDFVGLTPLKWKEGDHVNLYLWDQEGKEAGRRKLSFATVASEHRMRFTTRIREPISDYKKALHQMKVGDFAEISPPRGHFSLRREDRPILILSNGVGIATTRALVKAFEMDQTGIGRLTQLNVDQSGRIYEDEFDALSNMTSPANGFRSVYTSNRQDFYQEIDVEIRNLLFGSGRMPLYYLVGSYDFVTALVEYLISQGFEERDIMTDQQSSGQKSQPSIREMVAGKNLASRRIVHKQVAKLNA